MSFCALPIPRCILPVMAAMSLAACGQGKAEGEASSSAPSIDKPAAPASSGIGGDRQVRHAMQCWGVTQGAFMLNIADPERAAELPSASDRDYRAWAAQGEILIRDRGGSLADYKALQKAFQVSFVSARERVELRPVLEECLKTVPVAALDVQQPILTGE